MRQLGISDLLSHQMLLRIRKIVLIDSWIAGYGSSIAGWISEVKSHEAEVDDTNTSNDAVDIHGNLFHIVQ